MYLFYSFIYLNLTFDYYKRTENLERIRHHFVINLMIILINQI